MGFTKPIEDPSLPQDAKTKAKGDWGEQVACEHLIALGCAIVERQWKGHGFEIDIVAQKGTRMIFVEVKTRKTAAIDPVSAVDKKRQQHMIKAADVYLRDYKAPIGYQFDIIAVTGTPHNFTIEHVADAFFPSPRSRH